MPLQNEQQQVIQQMILKEIECADLLLKSLELEYDALAEHQVDTLEVVVREKQERIQQLESVSKQREKLLESYNLVTDKNADQQNKYQFSGNTQLSDLWDRLVNVAEKCRDKNRVNGSIVDQVSKRSRQALDILYGILPNSSSAYQLYDNTGQAVKSANKRSLVQV